MITKVLKFQRCVHVTFFDIWVGCFLWNLTENVLSPNSKMYISSVLKRRKFDSFFWNGLWSWHTQYVGGNTIWNPQFPGLINYETTMLKKTEKKVHTYCHFHKINAHKLSAFCHHMYCRSKPHPHSEIHELTMTWMITKNFGARQVPNGRIKWNVNGFLEYCTDCFGSILILTIS